MINSRYSDMEMQQWHDACSNTVDSNPLDSANAASRHGGARASMAKGQAERKQSRAAETTAQNPRQDDWASECLFNCYNG